MQDEPLARTSLRFIMAVFCLLMMTLLLAGVHQSIWEGVLQSAVMSSVTLFSLLLLAFRWANQPSLESNDDPASSAAGPIQFRISTLLLLTLLAGVYLGVLRDVVVKLAEQDGQGSFEQAFKVLAWIVTLAVGMFLPWLIIANVILSGLASIVKRPWGRRLILAFFAPRP